MEIKLESLYKSILSRNEELRDYIINIYGEIISFRKLNSYKKFISRFEPAEIYFKDCEEQFEDKNLLIALIMISKRVESEFEFDDDYSLIRLRLKVEIEGKYQILYFDELNSLQLKQLMSYCIIEQINIELNNLDNNDYYKEQESKYLEYMYYQNILKSKQKYFSLISKI